MRLVAAEKECRIMGTVLQEDEGVEGVTINLTGPESVATETDQNGRFSFFGLEEGQYNVTPQKTAYSFDPQEHSIELTACPEKKEINFTAGQTTAEINADPETIEKGESSTLVWMSSNADNCTIAPDIGKVEASGSIEVSPSNSTTYTISATGPGDAATDEANVEVTEEPQPEISIISPNNGETFLFRSQVMVRGTIEGLSEMDVGVSVNCTARNKAMSDALIPASIHGDEFVANNIPLLPGDNTITVKVTDNGSNQIGEKTVEVYYDPGDYILEVSSSRESGISPLEARLEIGSSFNIKDSTLTYTGPGNVDIVEHAPDEYGIKMTETGVYRFTVEVEDPASNLLTGDYAFVVKNKEEMDEMLRSKWNGMKSALADQDVQGALNYFTEKQRQLYSDIYSELRDKLPQIANDMKEIEMVSVSDSSAKYRILKDENYGGRDITVRYFVYFVKTPEGLWKLQRY